VIGYYRQDFSTLNFQETVSKTLRQASDGKHSEQEIRKIASSFFIDGEVVKQTIATLSEGQKGLLSLTCLVLQVPYDFFSMFSYIYNLENYCCYFRSQEF
jgi:ATPase subunit of ABC transporter with duplicated ATPase domains